MNDAAAAPSTGSHPVDQLWFALSSLRTTSLLAIAMAGLAAAAATIPQGREALELVQFDAAEDLRRLAVWGLTDVFSSAWVKALGVLLLVNILAVVLRIVLGRGATAAALPPSDAALVAPMTATAPERAVETLRLNLRAYIGSSPSKETVDGARVTMAFDTGGGGAFSSLLLHVGLVVVVVGAGLLAQPASTSRSVVRAELRVTDSRSNTTGFFDLAQGEPVKFFQWRQDYVIRNYQASHNGLGPAIRIERIDPQSGRRADFWVYLNAPPGFDRQHRRGSVSIEAAKMGLQPAPGHGVASNPASVLLLMGLAIATLGAFASARPGGRIWAEVEGRAVRLFGKPDNEGDPAFDKAFQRLALVARHAVGDVPSSS